MRNILATVPTGSRLYGYASESSDYDFIEITMPSLQDCMFNKEHCKQKIEDKVDTTRMSFTHFIKSVEKGSLQAIETVFAINQTECQCHDGFREFVKEIEHEIRSYNTDSNVMSGHFGVLHNKRVSKTSKDFIFLVRVAYQLKALHEGGLVFPYTELINESFFCELIKHKNNQPPSSLAEKAIEYANNIRDAVNTNQRKNISLKEKAVKFILDYWSKDFFRLDKDF